MSASTVLGRRTFTFVDQRQFAHLSGDHNPIHLDAIAARRTQAGAPVVHGIHSLLWALDRFAAAHGTPPPVRKMRMRFLKFVYVGDTAEVQASEVNASTAKLNLLVDATLVATVTVEFGEPKPDLPVPQEPLPRRLPPENPEDPAFEATADCSGRLAFAASPQSYVTLFPAATSWLGAKYVAALAASTSLVGMVCPGLHSIYGSLTAQTCADGNKEDVLDFRVTSVDPRFRLVRMAIAGGGLVGTIDSFARAAPTTQASMNSLRSLVQPTEFAGSIALVVGGSRGIGELTAKLIASGGGRVIITYQVGLVQAENVAREITSAGGLCEIMAFDVRLPAGPQLAALLVAPTHLYYFATPPIFGGTSSKIYTRSRLLEFQEFYVDGFWQIVQALRERRTDLSALYPSSIAVEERPRGMTEYAMAKAAAEMLCADMNTGLAPLRIHVKRLPRIATDQTATLVPVETASALDTMLPVVREVQSWPRAKE